MTATAIYLLTICLMALDCVAVGTHHARWRVFTKPAPMIALIVWFSMTGLWQGGLIWFGIALVFSLLGDIFLLFPFRLFIAGLVAFSLAQIFYIIGLNSTGGLINSSVLMILVAVVIIAFLDFNPLLRRIRRRPSSRNLLLPVLFYAILLSVMLFSAWLTISRSSWQGASILLVVSGGSLFFASDSLLAREKFVRPAKFGGVLVMITYFLGQLFLTTGAILHYLGWQI